jgi:uncharacterized membrane protein YcaP (DUF421 family)
MGKRQLGELDVSDLVSTLLVSEIASIPIDDPDIPILNAVLPILFILSIEIILSTIKNKSEKIKSVVESSPTYIIYKGKLLQKTLRDNRISINELLSELRSQGVGDISEVYYAIIEQNGSLSIIKNDVRGIAHPVIIDGAINYPALGTVGFSEAMLMDELKRIGRCPEETFLMTINDNGKIYIIERDKDEGKNSGSSNIDSGSRIGSSKRHHNKPKDRDHHSRG